MAYHDACHLANAQRITAEPRRLLGTIPGLTLADVAEPETHGVDPVRRRTMFDLVMARIAGRFARVEPRATARAHLLGPLSSVERQDT
ncbi:hypothetical protein C6376_33965 [Streptomyces sp. P3]|uniref:hypothetical protein n=1 Tax=Streptomyces sp. P3 TaxID=2135430 RepID=UPI000D1B07CC|nr:hypothetical protein [Streptomyces sp. P3]AVV45626.1 hypothetical protein C6376_33965 [Streptomyces sp. P3]